MYFFQLLGSFFFYITITLSWGRVSEGNFREGPSQTRTNTKRSRDRRNRFQSPKHKTAVVGQNFTIDMPTTFLGNLSDNSGVQRMKRLHAQIDAAQELQSFLKRKKIIEAKSKHFWATASSRGKDTTVEHHSLSFQDIERFSEMRSHLAEMHGRIGIALVKSFLRVRDLPVRSNYTEAVNVLNVSLGNMSGSRDFMQVQKRQQFLHSTADSYQYIQHHQDLLDIKEPRHIYDDRDTASFQGLSSFVEQVEQLAIWLVLNLPDLSVGLPLPNTRDSFRGTDRKGSSSKHHDDKGFRGPRCADMPSPISAHDGSAVFIHFHIPKTGGESINSFMNSAGFHRIRADSSETFTYAIRLFHRIALERQMASISSSSDGALSEFHPTKLFLEVHAGNAPSWFEARKVLMHAKWKLEEASIKTVLLTVVREPKLWAVSAFNYHCGGGQYEYCGKHTATVLQTTMRENPQCNYLIYGWIGWRNSRGKTLPTEVQCQAVGTSLRHSMHWIGLASLLNSTFEFLKSEDAQPEPYFDFSDSANSMTFSKALKHRKHAGSGFEIVRLAGFSQWQLCLLDNATRFDRNIILNSSCVAPPLRPSVLNASRYLRIPEKEEVNTVNHLVLL